MFEFIFKKDKEFKSGALKDDRKPLEQMKDYDQRELVSSLSVDWEEKPKEEWPNYPTFDQDGSGSCVAQALTKLAGIYNLLEEGKFVHLSAKDLYIRRDNDGPGMHTSKAIEDFLKNGATLEQQMPSQKMSEEEMNEPVNRTVSDKIMAQLFKLDDKNWVMGANNIEYVAEAIKKTGGVVATVKFKRGEWNKKVPEIGSGYGREWNYHKIVLDDYFLWEGNKATLVEDSWGADTGFDGRRVLTEDWFKEGRIYSIYYFDNLENERMIEKKEIERPEYEFNEDIEYGDIGTEVAKLQEILKIDGFFPNNVPNTGNYFGLTRKAVKEFQLHYKVAPKEELEAVDGFRVGKKTREKLNELCNNA